MPCVATRNANRQMTLWISAPHFWSLVFAFHCVTGVILQFKIQN